MAGGGGIDGLSLCMCMLVCVCVCAHTQIDDLCKRVLSHQDVS